MPTIRVATPAPVLPDPEVQPTLTVEEAGAALGLSRSSAYQAVRTGDLPAIKVGARWLVPVATLRQMLGLDR